jgi:cytochrome b subunit of formate dehydrogenase
MEDKQKNININIKTEQPNICFIRLHYSEIVQHIMFMVCFFILLITGFMAKIPEEVVNILGQSGETVFFWRSLLHRITGVALVLVSLYHIYYVVLTPAGRRWIVDMIPRWKDFKDLADNIRYFLGMKDAPPEFDRFNYKHKIEYAALILGNTLMTVSGVILWTEYKWSKFILDIAVIIHGMEAILACLAIIIWHLYDVTLRPGKSVTDDELLTGMIGEHEMKEEYPLHYKKIMADTELQKIYMKRREP